MECHNMPATARTVLKGALITAAVMVGVGVAGAIVSVAFHAPATGAGVAVGILALVGGLIGSFSVRRKVKAEYGSGRRPATDTSDSKPDQKAR
jgi:hypothetical protein